MKQWKKDGLVYLLAFLCLFAGLCWTVRAKERTVDDAYRTAQETLRATELTQYITSLEFGIRYGKNLENYYNMDAVLQAVLRTSPYVEGAYIVSNQSVLLYSAGEPMPNPEQMTVLHNTDGALYASDEGQGYAFMFMDISDPDGGVDDLYDIYGWLDDINEKLDMVQRLDFTEEGKVRATMDSEYLAGRTLSALGEMALQYLILAAACAAACVLTALGRRLWRERGGRIRREEGLHATAA